MKKSLLFLIFLISNLASAQSLQEFPLKDSMIYYSFERELPKESKRCLWTYLDGPDEFTTNDLKEYIDSVEIAKYTKLAKGNRGIFRIKANRPRLLTSNNKTCKDTAVVWIDVRFPDHKIIKTTTQLLIREIQQLRGVKEEIANGFKCQMVIYLEDKKATKIVFKGFQYSCVYAKEGKSVREDFPLEEIYFSLKNKGTANDKQKEYFDNVNTIVKDIERIYTKHFNYLVKISDL